MYKDSHGVDVDLRYRKIEKNYQKAPDIGGRNGTFQTTSDKIYFIIKYNIKIISYCVKMTVSMVFETQAQ